MKRLLELNNITKSFTGTKALSNVSFNLKQGEIHALLGENGAGKSTLIKIITGIHQPDEGEMILNGVEKVKFNTTNDSYDHGIAAIYQDASVFENLSIAENIFMGHQRVNKITRNIKWKDLYSRAEELIESLEVKIKPTTLVKNLSIAEKQLVEIVKALSANAKILIMDEPTSSLTKEEIDHLFKIAKKLKSEGTGIIFISHRLEEVFEIADRVTVIRDGQFIGTENVTDIDTNKLVQMMVGRSIDNFYPKSEVEIKEPILAVEGLCRKGEFNNVSFQVHEGEILGMSGLIGAGRTEIACAIYGITRPEGGKILFNGKEISINHPAEALEAGIAYLSESRGEFGLVLPLDIMANITIPVLKETVKAGFIRKNIEKKMTREYVELLDIRCSGMGQKVESLSGGNQQKVAIAKILIARAKVIILDEPTKGIDVGTKAAVHELVNELAKAGKAIILISSEIPELIGMSDRILVIHEGKIVRDLERKNFTQERILSAALGELDS